jgi:CHASE2 domain-containing sensor protein
LLFPLACFTYDPHVHLAVGWLQEAGSMSNAERGLTKPGRGSSGLPSFASAIGLACLAAMALVILIPSRMPGLVPAEDWSSDRRTAWLSPSLPRPHPRVAIVSITDDTLDAYKVNTRSPLDRGMLAEIVRAIDHQGACAMGLDVFVLRATTRDKDEALIAALADARMHVVAGVADSRIEMRNDQREHQAGFLARVGRSAGFLNLRTDDAADDAVRRHPRPAGDGLYPKAFAQRLAEVVVPALSTRDPSIDDQRRIAWLRPAPNGASPFLTIPAHQVPNRLTTPRQTCDVMGPTLVGSLKNRIVLVGAHFPNIDQHQTPLGRGRDTPGVDIHAQMTAEFIDSPSRQIHEPGPILMRAVLAALGALGFAAGWWLWRTPIVYSLGWGFGAALVVAAGLLSFYFFNMVLPFAACVLMWFLGVTAGRYLHAAQSPRHARQADL